MEGFLIKKFRLFAARNMLESVKNIRTYALERAKTSYPLKYNYIIINIKNVWSYDYKSTQM